MMVFVPYHVSGVWLPIQGANPVDSGSIGVGILLSSGVTISTIPRKGFRRLELDPTTERVLEIMDVDRGFAESLWIREERPLGYGYGASASRALALALAIEVIKGRGSLCRAGEVAHVAEVVCGSGLGDVIAEAMGMGIVARIKHGPPCRGVVDSFVPRKRYAIVTLPLGRMTTREMHEVYGERIRRVARSYIDRFLENPSIETFLEVSKGFSRDVGFLDRVTEERVLQALRRYLSQGLAMGFFIKKKLLTVVAEPSAASEIGESLAGVMGVEPSIDLLGTRRAVVEI